MSLNEYIDHTLLKPEACEADFQKLCSEALEHQFAAVCVPSSWLSYCKKLLGSSSVKLCTVVGFPGGYNASSAKAFEAKVASDLGAHEIDMVINVGFIKSSQWPQVLEDIKSVRQACSGKVLKVILETALLTDDEISQACQMAMDAGADFVKTSTGFSTRGASLEDIQIMKQAVGDRLGIKASGGIRDVAAAKAMIEAGATRLGTSQGVQIIQDLDTDGSY